MDVMSRIRPWTNGDQVALESGNVPVKAYLYDAAGNPVNLVSSQVPVYMADRGIFLQDSPNLDAFGRLRVSNPTTIFDNHFKYGLNPDDFSNSLNGAGSISHLPGESAAELSTGGTTSGDYAILQTKRYMRYQPGKSQLVFMTATLGAEKANVTQRIGYFDDENGLFFEQTIDGLYIVVRTNTSGTPADTGVEQADWNLDSLDGTGPSGVTLDTSKSQIFMIDFEWLGVGRIRFGFVIDGMVVYCHEVLNANNLTTVYMSTPNLPVRASIENTGTAASTTTMKQFCMVVMSEGGVFEDAGNEFSIGRGVTAFGVTTRVPVLSIRPSVTFNSITNRGHVTFSELEVIAASNHCFWELVENGSLTGASWGNVDATHSIADYDTSATAISGGIVRNTGWSLAGLGSNPGKSQGNNIIELFNDFAGTTPDILTVVCTSFTGTTNINALMRWTEQR